MVLYRLVMNAVEFVIDLKGAAALEIPSEIAARLPKAGKARVIILTRSETDIDAWHAAAYQQFLGDDAAEDIIYDSMR